MYKRILIGIEKLEDARKALKKVADFYKTWNSKIVVFHSIKQYMKPVSIPTIGWSYALPSSTYGLSRYEYIKAGRKLLEESKKLFEKSGIPIETRLIEDFKPEDYAKDMVKEEDFDLVIIREKEHYSWLDTLFGSVPTHIIADVDSDVLLLH
ncbi:MAG: universal stress protein [Candidatus Hermodarchaeota archaeon]